MTRREAQLIRSHLFIQGKEDKLVLWINDKPLVMMKEKGRSVKASFAGEFKGIMPLDQVEDFIVDLSIEEMGSQLLLADKLFAGDHSKNRS